MRSSYVFIISILCGGIVSADRYCNALIGISVFQLVCLWMAEFNSKNNFSSIFPFL